MLLYADEDFSYPVVEELRRLGHDVVTAQEDGRMATPDPDILARAHSLRPPRANVNRRHFEPLHRQGLAHVGILSATHDSDSHVWPPAFMRSWPAYHWAAGVSASTVPLRPDPFFHGQPHTVTVK